MMTRDLNHCERCLLNSLRAEQIEAQELLNMTINKLKAQYDQGMKQAQETYNETLNAALFTFERA